MLTRVALFSFVRPSQNAHDIESEDDRSRHRNMVSAVIQWLIVGKRLINTETTQGPVTSVQQSNKHRKLQLAEESTHAKQKEDFDKISSRVMDVLLADKECSEIRLLSAVADVKEELVPDYLVQVVSLDPPGP